MKVFVRQHDRSEVGMTQPVIDALVRKGYWCSDWRCADRVIVAGDRKEAVRDCMTYYEAGKVIDHLGALEVSDGVHYDHIYRAFISKMAIESGGILFGLGHHARSDFFPVNVVGPPQIETAKNRPRPTGERYQLMCFNPQPWIADDVRIDCDAKVYVMSPGHDDGSVSMFGTECTQLPDMCRDDFLAWVQHAEHVWGNSSLLCYEAPIWHDDSHIHLVGKRNHNRPIVRWDGDTPSSNIIAALERVAK